VRFRRFLEVSFVAAFAGAALAATPHTAPRISVGEITATVQGLSPDTVSLLRRLVNEEVSRLRLAGQGSPEAYVLSAALVRLEVQRTSDGVRASSVVSATLRREGSGAILALLSGRGRAEAESGGIAGARTGAIEAAVRGAVRRVPEAL
jgi:hypothetical protein